MPRRTLGLALLILVTCIWGSTFAVVKTLGESLAPQSLIAWRFLIGTVALLPLLAWRRPTRSASSRPPRSLLRDSLTMGGWLIVGYGTQTIALQTTSANRAAFITALSVVLVPLWQTLVARRALGGFLWAAVALAVAGLALLSWEGGPLVIGDAWALGCAVSYAGFILALDRTTRWHAALPFTLLQLLSVAALAWLWALLSGASLRPPASTWSGLIYLGLAATALTTLMQTLGQRWVSAAQASIIYALEPVSATLFSFLLIGEQVGLRGLIGGALVVAATVLSQKGHVQPPAHQLAEAPELDVSSPQP
ncbi:DMT family transporter [Deinococcus sp.]|uniref:DMT family transporter n=1 Tax=Deinococcus sp. TaxID=47478 RepID=UPI0025E577AA|nr:DMT family transporter [Deinococcus sp.]